MLDDDNFPGIFNSDGSRFCYLDSAATSQKHKSFLDSFDAICCREYGSLKRGVCSKSLSTTVMYEGARKEIAEFIGSDENEIVFTSSTTDSINLVATSLFYTNLFKSKKSIYISWIDHHSNVLPWINLGKNTGLEIKYIPFDKSGKVDLNLLEELLDEDVFLLAISHISNVTGNINPVDHIGSICKKYDILFFMDAAQSICHTKVNVNEMNVDFLAFSAHKFYGPNGLGVLYGKNNILDKMPPVKLGGGIVFALEGESFSYLPHPEKFEAGTAPTTQVIGFANVIKWFKTIDFEDVVSHDERLCKYLLRGLEKLPVIVLKDKESNCPIVSFSFKEKFSPFDVQHFINLQADICLRTGDLCAKGAMKFFGLDYVMRVSLTIYNKKEDIDLFLICLEKALEKMRSF